MREEGFGERGPVGVHPQRSVLFAQVSDSDPRMAFDERGTMHQFGTKGSFGKVYLGDVARAALRSLGTHSPSKFTEMPRVDEQRWVLECETEEVSDVCLKPALLGFGLFAKCFVNEIVIEGPSKPELGARWTSLRLGRNPREPVRVRDSREPRPERCRSTPPAGRANVRSKGKHE